MKKGVLLFALFILAFTCFSVAESIYDNIPIQIQALDEEGAVSVGTYTFKIEISNSATCSPILYTNTTILTTDARGIVSYNLLDVDLDFDEQYWFCYYRDGVLKSTIKAARVPYAFSAKNVTLSGVNVDTNLNMGSYNISTDRIIVNEICNDTNCFTLGDLVSSGFFDGNYSNYSNSSFYWDNLNSYNTTQMENSDGVLNILTSWLYGLFYSKEDVYNKTEVDSRIPNLSNYYNKTEMDNNLSYYLLITDQRFNETSYIDNLILDYYTKLEVYNKTEVDSRIPNLSNYYNKTEIDNNLTLYLLATDQRFNETSLINVLSSELDNVNSTGNIMALGFYNKTEVDNLISFAGNSSWNQSLADTLYAGIEWDYNQTTPAIAYTDSINNSLSSWVNSIFAKISDVFTKSEIETGYYNKTQINDFGFVNSTDVENYNDTLYINQIVLNNNASWSSTYNSTYDSYNATGLIKDWNSTGIIVDYNGTGYLINWNSTGLIKDWNGDIISANASLYDWVVSQNYLTSISEVNWDGNYSTYLTLFNWNKTYADTLYYGIDNPSNFITWVDAVNGTLATSASVIALNSTGLIKDWNGDIISANTSMKNYVDANYYLSSNPYGFYNSTTLPLSEETNWNANYSIFLTHIDWSKVVNGTLALNSSLSDYLLKLEWNSTNESYYLASNPFGFYNSTNFPYTHLSNFTNDLEIEQYNDSWINQTFFNKTEIISYNYYNSSNFNISDYRTLTNNSFDGDVNISGNLNVNGTNFNIPTCASGQSLSFDGSSFSCVSSTSEGGTGIVESGSNANGNYIKFADGTMMAWTTGNATFFLNTALAYNWTFPSPFSSTEGLVVSITPNGNPVLNATLRPTTMTYHRTSSLTTTGTQVGFMTNSSSPFTADSIGGIDVFAIGRWTDLTNISVNDSTWAVNSTTGDVVLFNSSKNVGIGTTNPRFLLEVNGSSNIALFGNGTRGVIIQSNTYSGGIVGYNGTSEGYNDLDIRATSGIGSGIYLNSSSRNVGIGTTNPTVRLNIGNNSITDEAILVLSKREASLILLADSDNINETDNPYIKLRQDGGAIEAIIGLTSEGFDSEGSVVSNAKENALLIETIDAEELQFGTNRTVRMTINELGNVGIGTNAPEQKLHIYAGDSGATSYANSNLVLEDSTSELIQFISPSSSVQGIMFGDEDFAYSGYIRYDHTTDYMNIYTAGVSRILINSVGVGVGISPSVALDVSGSIEYTGTCIDVSDITLKENLNELNNTLSRFMNLTPISFNMINDTTVEYGLSAQEVQQYFPEVVSVIDDEGHLGVSYVSLISPMIKAMQEQQEIIEQQNNTINEMKQSLCEIGIEKWC